MVSFIIDNLITFSVDKNSYQLGDEIKISGQVIPKSSTNAADASKFFVYITIPKAKSIFIVPSDDRTENKTSSSVYDEQNASSMAQSTSLSILDVTAQIDECGNFNAVIEIPAGTNKKIEFNNSTQAFEVDKNNGKDRVIQFLPYIGNYGYIPSTYSNPNQGGDGDALDVLVISESVKTGSIIEIIPIAVLKLLDEGEIDYKILYGSWAGAFVSGGYGRCAQTKGTELYPRRGVRVRRDEAWADCPH